MPRFRPHACPAHRALTALLLVLVFLKFVFVVPRVNTVGQAQHRVLIVRRASMQIRSILLNVPCVCQVPPAMLLEPQAFLPAHAVVEERYRLPQVSLRAAHVRRALSVILAHLHALAVLRALTTPPLASPHAFFARLERLVVPARHPATLAQPATLVSPLPLGQRPPARRASRALLASLAHRLASIRNHHARRGLIQAHLLRASRVPRAPTALLARLIAAVAPRAGTTQHSDPLV